MQHKDMKKMVKTAFDSPVTAFAVLLGITATLTGICTATGHNILFGAMSLALAYANHKEEQRDIQE